MPRARRLPLVVDVVTLAFRRGTLAAMLARRGDGWTLPRDAPRGGEPLDGCALRILREACGAEPRRVVQAEALGGLASHPAGAEVSVVYAGFVGGADEVPARTPAEWADVDGLPPLSRHDATAIDACIAALRLRLQTEPIAFDLLPAAFTLAELQAVEERLLGRSLHKATFRRTLHARAVVEPIEGWRLEGRGRPAQLFRRREGTPA